MFKQFKAVKALALVAVFTTGGQLFALGTGGTGGGGSGGGATGADAAVYGTASGYYAYDSVATTPSSVVTTPTVMAIKTQKIMGLVSAVAAEAVALMQGGEAVTSGGDGGVKLAGSSGSQHKASAWVRASHAAINNAEKGQEWNGNSYLMMLGGDYRFNKMFCAGLGLSYSRLDARTEFNKGTQLEDTLGVNPYLIIVPHKNFNLELVAGASWTNGKDTRRIEEGPKATKINNEFKSSPKSQALFGGVFANFINTAGKASYGLQVGYLMMQTKFKAFKETSADSAYDVDAKSPPANTFKAGTVTGKIKAGYQLTPSVVPFVTLHAMYDAQQNKGAEYAGGPGAGGQKTAYKVTRSAFGGGGGLGFKGNDTLSGAIEADYTQRGKLTTWVTGLRLHYGF